MTELVKKTFVITEKGGLRPAFVAAWNLAKQALLGRSLVLTLSNRQSKRSLEQNKKMWAMLSDISAQVLWPVNGAMTMMSPEEWKDVLTAALRQVNGAEVRIAQGIEGGFVFLGQRTSKMPVKLMAELIEYMYAFGAEKEVRWSEPAPEEWYELRAAA